MSTTGVGGHESYCCHMHRSVAVCTTALANVPSIEKIPCFVPLLNVEKALEQYPESRRILRQPFPQVVQEANQGVRDMRRGLSKIGTGENARYFFGGSECFRQGAHPNATIFLFTKANEPVLHVSTFFEAGSQAVVLPAQNLKTG